MTEQFIEKAKLIHGDKYDYSKVDYINCSTKIIIICKEHGEFTQTPNNHLHGYGCGKCAGTAKSNTKEFIEKAKLIHEDLYDYSKVNYKNNITKTIIICKEHGEFQQTPKLHLKGAGCSKCAGTAKSNTKEFIEKAKSIHGDKYDYSKVDYKNTKTEVIIICKIHGNFKQTPSSHLNGNGCCKCSGNYTMTTEEFIEKAKSIHEDKYDYSKVEYKNTKTNVIIICKIHGNFDQTPSSHLNGNGCCKCSGNYTMTTEEFIEKAKSIHNDKYDYSKVEYKNSNTDIIIICKIHGEFKQKPVIHYWNKSGCPKCANKNITTEEFIEKSKLIHGDKYDYSKTEYLLSNKEVIIICKIHKDFLQIPNTHLNGHGCPKCGGVAKSNTKEFIENAKLIHCNLYDYSKVNYINNITCVIIICKIHGEYLQTPKSHLKGHGCVKCYQSTISKRLLQTTENFIERSKKIHGDLYDYSKVDYSNCNTKVIIICKKHGEFYQNPGNHYNSGNGCPKCCNIIYSKMQILWLNFLSKFHNINIQHGLNDGEFLIPNTNYKADGYCKENNTVYEFHGDFWHGNPKIYKQDEINKKTNCSFKELYEKTLIKENKIKELGYNLIIIWENDWKKINNAVKIIQRKFINNYQKDDLKTLSKYP